MKITGTLRLLACVALIAACAALLRADFQRGNYRQTNLGSLTQAAVVPQKLGATYAVEAYPLYRPRLAPDAGRELVEANCSTCHSTRYIIMQPALPADTWAAEVNKMNKTYGAGIPDDATPVIIKYLQTHYTPETRAK
jgi:cytochrome c5